MTRRPLALAVLLLLLLLGRAAGAGASPTQESTVQDDEHLIYASPAEVRATLGELAALGADRLRITVVWAGVAPDPASRRRPAFDATDPAAYPPGVWDKFDLVAREAAERGLGVNFNVTAPAPL